MLDAFGASVLDDAARPEKGMPLTRSFWRGFLWRSTRLPISLHGGQPLVCWGSERPSLKCWRRFMWV